MAEQLSFGLVVTDPHAFKLASARKPRRCLSCDETFISRGPGNRICGRCKSLESWASPNEFAVVSSAAF
jgi:hypothetical protein